MNMIWKDVRYAVRMLWHNPTLAVGALLTLALGVGANTAMFTVLNSVVLRELPFPDPHRLVMIWHDNRLQKVERDDLSYPTFQDLEKGSRTVARMSGISPLWNFVVMTPRGNERTPGYYVSTNFFDLLGVQPVIGRTFQAEDTHRQVALVSHRYWLAYLGGDPQIVGQSINLGHPYEIIGVIPPSFRFKEEADLWVPLEGNFLIERGRTVRWLNVLGQLSPGATLDQAQRELSALAANLEEQFPDTNTGLGIAVVSLHDQVVGGSREALLFLSGAVLFVLLIACANVAALLLNRSVAREKEIALRRTLGATGRRIIALLLTESLVLALAGGALGLVLAAWLLDLLLALAPADLPRASNITLDGRALVFTLLLTVAAGVLAGLVPAWRGSRSQLADALRDVRSSEGSAGRRLREAFAVGEIALAVLLLVGAGLMIRSFVRLLQVDAGFSRENVLTLQISSEEEDNARRLLTYQEMFERLEALPGVERVGGVTRIPLREGVTTKLEIFDRPVSEGERPEVEFRRASDGYFDAMGITLKEGRGFLPTDSSQAPPVSVVNQVAAQRFWPGESAIGKRIRSFGSSPDRPWFTIVGVVENVRHFGLEQEPRPEVYMSFNQGPPFGPLLAIRTAVDPSTLVADVRRTIRDVDPQTPISRVATMQQLLADSLAQRRFNTVLISAFALLALLLAAIGVFGIVSFLVSGRFREIGIRVAIGARQGQIFRMIVGRGIRLLGLGLLVGLGAAWGLSRLLTGLLFQIAPTDPTTWLAVSFLLAMFVLAGCSLPALRATRIDPVEALRQE